MHAVLIDPINRAVLDVECSGSIHDKDGLPGIYTLTRCDLITLVYMDAGGHEALFLDDEGLLKPNHLFKLHRYPTPLAGCGLILSSDDEGETIATNFTADQIRPLITFLGGPQEIEIPAPEIYIINKDGSLTRAR